MAFARECQFAVLDFKVLKPEFLPSLTNRGCRSANAIYALRLMDDDTMGASALIAFVFIGCQVQCGCKKFIQPNKNKHVTWVVNRIFSVDYPFNTSIPYLRPFPKKLSC